MVINNFVLKMSVNCQQKSLFFKFIQIIYDARSKSIIVILITLKYIVNNDNVTKIVRNNVVVV